MICPIEYAMINQDESENQSVSLAVRDRILAYLYQLDTGPVESLEIALKALAESPERSQAIENLLKLLSERGQDQEEAALMTLAAEKRLPPLNRQPMVSEWLNISIGDFLSRIITGGFRPAKKRETAPGDEK